MYRPIPVSPAHYTCPKSRQLTSLCASIRTTGWWLSSSSFEQKWSYTLSAYLSLLHFLKTELIETTVQLLMCIPLCQPMCVAWHWLYNITQLLINELHFIHAVCRENEYVHPSSGMCTACPSNSTSPGGKLSMCTCNAGTGRVNESDVTLQCLGECQEHNASYKHWLLVKWIKPCSYCKF